MPEEHEHEPVWGMVMPFTVCKSQGGPYDDESFVVGFAAGVIDERLARGPAILENTVQSGVMPQLDLIAMRYGYSMESTPWEEHPDEWTHVVFRRSSEGGETVNTPGREPGAPGR